MYLRARTVMSLMSGAYTIAQVCKAQNRVYIDLYTENADELENIQAAINSFDECPIPKGYKINLPKPRHNIEVCSSQNLSIAIRWWL